LGLAVAGCPKRTKFATVGFSSLSASSPSQ